MLGDRRQWVAVRKKATRRDSPGPGQERSWAAPTVLDKKLEKGCYDRKKRVDGREKEGTALHLAEELAK